MPQFFVKQANVNESTIIITEKSDIKHISSVLRLKNSDHLTLIDENEFTYKTQIIEILPDLITTKVIDKIQSKKKLNISLTLAQSILKSSAQEFVIQKATELGVKEIFPLITKYTVVKINSEKDKLQKLERWQKIAYEACKQCERANIPTVNR